MHNDADTSNFVKVSQFSPDGKTLVTGSDDHLVRIYRPGDCSGLTSFSFGACVAMVWVYILIVLLVLLIVGIAVFIYFKKVRIPAENKGKFTEDVDYDRLPEDTPERKKGKYSGIHDKKYFKADLDTNK